MTDQAIVSRATWLEARRDLLAAEKELTHRTDRVAELRRRLPRVKVEQAYEFDGPDGKVTLAGLFAGRHQLIVQHFMMAPGWEEGCPSCSFMADHTDGMLPHLAARGVTFVAVSRAPLDEIEPFRRRMGWKFPWVSSNANRFNYDFCVSFTPEQVASGQIDYNFGGWPVAGEEWPGVSVFVKDDAGGVLHTYSTYGRGVEVMMGTYRMLDLTPRGRDEGSGYTMEWVRYHDSYATGAGTSDTCCGGHPRGA